MLTVTRQPVEAGIRVDLKLGQFVPVSPELL
ncbi:hypothetical protein SBDP1_760039 [Syntrophobacter sp. SbD1]|nr:hypothetical protein SBDP1_760039 [Syntrophobacter sp. SbD1]